MSLTREEAIDGICRAITSDNKIAFIDKIYNDHEAQLKAKDKEIYRLNCRAYHAEGYINDLHNNPKDKKFYYAKARSIVAMLFWEWRMHEREKERDMAYASKCCFYEAYRMLKDTK